MPDFSLDAMLEIDDSEVEDVNDELEASVSAEDDGGLTPGQQDEQEGMIAGGVSKGLMAAGVIAGVLSQLKSITGIINAVFGAISRALIPAVEVIAEIIRPLIQGINDFLQRPGEIAKDVSTATGVGQTAREEGAVGPFTGIGGTISREQAQNLDESPTRQAIDGLSNFLFGNKSADQTDEAKKSQFQQILEDAQRDITGAFR